MSAELKAVTKQNIQRKKKCCRGTENSLPTPYCNYVQIHDQMTLKKNVKIKTYREETSKKIPHLDDVVCHAVQTETRHGSLLALHPNAEVQLSTQTFHRPVTAS